MEFNPFRQDVIADPYPYYEELRRTGRLLFNEQLGRWLMTGFDDCAAVLKDAVRFSSERQRRTTPGQVRQMREMQGGSRAPPATAGPG